LELGLYNHLRTLATFDVEFEIGHSVMLLIPKEVASLVLAISYILQTQVVELLKGKSGPHPSQDCSVLICYQLVYMTACREVQDNVMSDRLEKL